MEEKLLTSYRKHEYTPIQVFARSKRADEIWMNVESSYSDVAEYFQPDRKDFYSQKNDFSDNKDVVYTALGSDCCNQFVNTIQSLVSPINGDFMDLEAGAMYERVADKFGISKDELNEELAKVNEYANELKNNVTNFDVSLTEAYYDLFIGTCCLLIVEGNRNMPINIMSVPLTEFTILEGADGQVSDVFRKYKKTASEINQMWSEVDLPIEMDDSGNEKEIELLECAYLDTTEMDYVYAVYKCESKEQIVMRRSDTCPFIVGRWNKQSGETWGKGVGISALEDMKTFNGLVKASYEASAFEVPMFLSNGGGMFDVNEIELEGGAIIDVPNTDTSGQRPALEQLQVNNRRENSRMDMERLEMSIRRACLADSLPDSAMGQGKTATEIMEIARSMRKDFTSVFGRLIRFQQSIVRRFYAVLADVGLLNNRQTLEPIIDANKINGLWFACNTNTPLTKQLAFSEVQSMVNVISMFLQLDPSGQTLAKTLKLNESTIRIADKSGYPIDLIYSLEEIAENEQAMGQAMQQQEVAQRELNVLEQNAIERGKVDK